MGLAIKVLVRIVKWALLMTYIDGRQNDHLKKIMYITNHGNNLEI